MEVKRFLIKVDTGFVGATHEDEIEFEDESWEAMSEEERTEQLESACQELVSNNIDAYWEEV